MMSLFFLFLPSWLVKVEHYDPEYVRWATLAGLVTASLLTPPWGYLADRSKPWLSLCIGLGPLLLGYPVLLLMTGSSDYVVGFVLGGFALSLCSGLGPKSLPGLFAVSVRYSGVALSYNLAFAFIGGFVPLMAIGIIQLTGNPLWTYTIIFIAGFAGLLSVVTLRKKQVRRKLL